MITTLVPSRTQRVLDDSANGRILPANGGCGKASGGKLLLFYLQFANGAVSRINASSSMRAQKPPACRYGGVIPSQLIQRQVTREYRAIVQQQSDAVLGMAGGAQNFSGDTEIG